MPHYTPEELFQRAQLGSKLKASERILAMLHLEKSGEIQNWTEPALAKILGCRVGEIPKLRVEAQRQVALAVSPAEAMNYFVEFLRNQDFLIKEAKTGVEQAVKNTGIHQGYMRLMMEAISEKIAKLQSVGVIPKELGRLTTVSEEWTATVSEDGVASVGESMLPGSDTVQ